MSERRDLVGRIAAGDADALSALYREHREAIRALCARMTGSRDLADDLTQEVFVRAARGAAGFRGEASAGTWLYRIARNVCLDHLRRARRGDAVEAAVGRELALPVGADGAAGDAGDDRFTRVEDGLRRLAIEDREVVVLAACVGLGSARLAEVLECTPGAARVRLHRALVRLRRLCRDREEETDGLRAGA